VIVAAILFGTFAYLEFSLKEYIYEKIKTAITKEVLLAKLFLEEDFPGYPRFKEISDISISVGEAIDARVSIINLDGTVLGDSDVAHSRLEGLENHLDRPEIREALSSGMGESRRFSTTVHKDMLYIAAVLGKDEPAGFVRAAVPLTDIDMVSSRLKKILLLALFAAFLVTIVASFLAAFFITRPIKKISSIAGDISKGKLDEKIYYGHNDEIGDLVGAFNHMSGQVKAQIDGITSQRARLEAVLLSMSDGVMAVDTKGRIIFVNGALRQMLSMDEQYAGKKPLEVIRKIEVQDFIEAILRDKSISASREISLVPEGKVFMANGTPIINDREVAGAVVVFHDITELRQLERMRKDFVANVSHELRTPASNIKGFAETLAAGAIEDKDNAMEFVKIIEENSERLVRLIANLLDLSRIESGKVSVQIDRCSASKLLLKVVKSLEKEAELKKVELVCLPEENDVFMKADENMIFQAIFNLVDNAIKYTSPGSKVSLSVKRSGNFAEIEVKDNGPGIPEKDLDRIFERFYRVDKSRSGETGSTGLGLSIVKHIAEEHGGSVRVESVYGAGCSFFLFIPFQN
jgi:two-component system, OmpR family, phosphate regulon sensor histidine kinase PhoR